MADDPREIATRIELKLVELIHRAEMAGLSEIEARLRTAAAEARLQGATGEPPLVPDL